MAPFSREIADEPQTISSNEDFDSLQSWLESSGPAEYALYQIREPAPHLPYDEWARSAKALGMYLYHLTLSACDESDSEPEGSDDPVTVGGAEEERELSRSTAVPHAQTVKVPINEKVSPPTQREQIEVFTHTPQTGTPEDTSKSSSLRRGLRARTAAQQRPYFHHRKRAKEQTASYRAGSTEKNRVSNANSEVSGRDSLLHLESEKTNPDFDQEDRENHEVEVETPIRTERRGRKRGKIASQVGQCQILLALDSAWLFDLDTVSKSEAKIRTACRAVYFDKIAVYERGEAYSEGSFGEQDGHDSSLEKRWKRTH